jgi:hypothetical protein
MGGLVPRSLPCGYLGGSDRTSLCLLFDVQETLVGFREISWELLFSDKLPRRTSSTPVPPYPSLGA